MKAITYYITFPFLFVVARLPFPLLYLVSDAVYFLVYRVLGYRKKVVFTNLRNSFPDKTEKEINVLARDFYKYLCDVILETLKTTSWNADTVRKHTKFTNPEVIQELYEKEQSFLVVLGHLGNWEWGGPCFALSTNYQLYVVYHPLSNPYFERLFAKARTKFNTKIIPRKNALKSIISNRKTINATALVADQAPTPVKTAFWTKFLNQDTAVFTGPEKMSKMLDYPVVYMNIVRVKRGYYEVTAKVLFDKPKETDDNEITLAFNSILEESIIKNPVTWLWSHRRWKHKRSTEE